MLGSWNDHDRSYYINVDLEYPRLPGHYVMIQGEGRFSVFGYKKIAKVR